MIGARQRTIARVVTLPPPAPGFIGPGHTAVEVLDSAELRASDPFVLLMDDRIDWPAGRRRIGGAHPHAGLETVTLILEGTITDRDEGALSVGDAVWMTAGRGIIHNEHVEAGGRIRILQLWIRLPARDRGLAPRFEIIRAAAVPVRRAPGAIARVYSGASGDARSPTKNRAPITLVDLALEPHATFAQDLPPSYLGFVLVIAGAITIGDRTIAEGQTSWLAPGEGDLVVASGATAARAILYTGEPQREPLVHHGPFVAGSELEIVELHRRYRAGMFTSMASLRPDPTID